MLSSSKYVKFNQIEEHHKSYIASLKNPLDLITTREHSKEDPPTGKT